MSPRVSGHRPGITRAVLAGVVATTLGLAACGANADEDDTKSASTGASETSPSATGSTAPTEGAGESEKAGESADAGDRDGSDGDPEAPGTDGEPADSPEGDRTDAPAPEGRGGNRAAPAGESASKDDAAQITALEKGFAEDRVYADYLRYTYENTCNADLEQWGGRESLMKDADSNGSIANKQASEVMGGLPVIHGVNDVRVDGDRATSNLDHTMNGKRQTIPKNYVREDGQWRTCAA